jgi:biopolymer transport protein ExbD
MNVTPLVDVVLVLLIIFMVVVPMMEKSPHITLPNMFNPDTDPKGKTDPYTVSLTQKGEVYFEKELLAKKDIEARLKKANQDDMARRIVVRADTNTPYEEVRKLFKICQTIGFPGLSMRVNALSKDGK